MSIENTLVVYILLVIYEDITPFPKKASWNILNFSAWKLWLFLVCGLLILVVHFP